MLLDQQGLCTVAVPVHSVGALLGNRGTVKRDIDQQSGAVVKITEEDGKAYADIQ